MSSVSAMFLVHILYTTFCCSDPYLKPLRENEQFTCSYFVTNLAVVVPYWWECSAADFLESGAGKMSQSPGRGRLRPDLFFPALRAFLRNCVKLIFCFEECW